MNPANSPTSSHLNQLHSLPSALPPSEPTFAAFSTSLQPPNQASNKSNLHNLNRWKKLVDRDEIGHLSKDDILVVYFACGVEVSVADMDSIVNLHGDERARASLAFVNSMGTSLETAEDMVSHHRLHQLVFRPDNFQPLPFKTYFLSRFVAYMTIPGLVFFIQKWQIPRSTEREKIIYNIIYKVLNTAFSAVNIAFVALFILSLSGRAKMISVAELGVVFGFMISTWATQCIREADSVSKEGLVRRENNSLAMTRLMHTNIRMVNGITISGVGTMLLHKSACAESSRKAATSTNILNTLTQSTALAMYNSHQALPTPTAGGGTHRRRSSLSEEIATAARNAVLRGESSIESTVHGRYNIFGGGLHMMLPWAVSFGVSSVPTVFRLIAGEDNMFDADVSGADISTSVVLTLLLILITAFVFQVQLNDALSDLSTMNTWVNLILGSIARGSKLTNTQKNDELDFHIHLDSVKNVNSFEMLYRSIGQVCVHYAECHKRAFEAMSFTCLVSVGVLFVVSAMDAEIDAWNVLLFVWSTIILVAMMTAFWLVVQIDSKMSKRVVKLLKLQQQHNEHALIMDTHDGGQESMSSEKRAELTSANALINVMCERITVSQTSLKILGVVPLREEALIKFGGAIGAALFTTALRQSLKM